ncbi:heliorhodopsin HeR [Candidatus Lokiarchaeum ossiferum]|uniref:heliorhodopsin HeR n=1 Tax=Candidatus Lokiarchaeum ossiferum TaxID=2951803 RepID=UPI00352E9925
MSSNVTEDDSQGIIYTDGSKSPVDFDKLTRFNLIMGILHFVQASIMLILGFTIDNLKNFQASIYILEVEYPNFVLSEDVFWTLKSVGPIVASFLFFSAIAHFLLAGPLKKFYKKNLAKRMNPLRWFEYAFSSSIMIFFIAVLFGVKEFWILLLIFMLNALMNLFGHTMELHNQYTEKTNWTSYIYGWIAGIMPWVVITAVFYSAMQVDGVPWFVPYIYGFEIALFMSFAFNMLLQYLKVGPWKDYVFGERVYIILSLVAKTLLAWFVFAGVLQPGETGM